MSFFAPGAMLTPGSLRRFLPSQKVCLKAGGKENEPLVLLMRDKDHDKTAVICVLRCGIAENVSLQL